MVNYGDSIHAAIQAAIQGFDFPKIDYPTKRTRMTDNSGAPGSTVKARSIKVDQRSSTFEDPQNRQRRYRERTIWVWVADLNFNGAVSLEEFEDDFANNPPIIPRDDAQGRPRQVTIFLDEAEEYVHPPRKAPSTGTRVRYRFEAVLTPT